MATPIKAVTFSEENSLDLSQNSSQSPSVQSEDHEEYLVNHLSGIKLSKSDNLAEFQPSFAIKRIAESMTVEGTPLMYPPTAKRLDLNPTPLAFKLNEDYPQNCSLESSVQSIPMRPFPSESIPRCKNGRGVLVIPSCNEGHITGEHQENALRIALLTSHERGCLRREELKDNIHWLAGSCAFNRPATLADLLR